MTSLLIFHADADEELLQVVLSNAGVEHESTALAVGMMAAAGSVRRIRFDLHPSESARFAPAFAGAARATRGEHRFLLVTQSGTANRFALAESLLPDNPQTRYRMAVHAVTDALPSIEACASNSGALPAPLLAEGTASTRLRLSRLAEMQTTHVLGTPSNTADLAVLARAASDCAMAAGDIDFLLQLIAYRRVRGWLDFQREPSVPV